MNIYRKCSTFKRLPMPRSCTYNGIPTVRFSGTALPVSGTQTVNGSPPICSLLMPLLLASVTLPGTVTGTGAAQTLTTGLLPALVTLTSMIFAFVRSTVQLMLYAH